MRKVSVGLWAVLAAIVIVLVVVGGYLGGWWLKTDVTNRNSKLVRGSFEQQTTYRDEMIRRISDVQSIDLQIAQSPELRPQLEAQRRAIVNIVCRDNTHIQGGLDNSIAAFVSKEC